MRLNWGMIWNIWGLLIAFSGMLMLACVPFSLYYNDQTLIPFVISGSICLFIGGSAYFFTLKNLVKEIKKREGMIIVSLGWMLISLFGSLPYLISHSIPDLTNAFFETISGFTTTGATILTDIEIQPPSILLWRSLTQWIGGLGIIVLTVAILPILGIGGMQLFQAESSLKMPDKIHPRIKETAKRLWLVYFTLTFAAFFLLKMAGMGWFDALNHGLTTLASGGFSTKNNSIAAFPSPLIQYILITFMFLSGVNFSLMFFFATGQPQRLFENEEFKYYSRTVLGFTLLVIAIIFMNFTDSYESTFRSALFQVVSIITTTGFITEDYTQWSPFSNTLFLFMLFLGACTGSTSGGIKIIRHILLFKNSILELKRQIHPSAIIPVRFNKKGVAENIIQNVSGFILIYMLIFIISSLLLSLLSLDLSTSLGATATCLGNVGPGIGSVGPVNNFAHLPALAKWILSFLMLIGRLELFTVLVLFTAYFWRSN